MAQQIRPSSEIFTPLADNTTGDIGAEDVRDAILTIAAQAVPPWTDVDFVATQQARRPDGRVYEANDDIPQGTGFVIGDTGGTRQRCLDIHDSDVTNADRN